MKTVHFILATAGHVDHGKSALVRALTGTDPDRLPEEKARGITIELGFASLTLNSPAAIYHVGVVDVPGHEDFVKNMVAGVGSIDAALLVVAADDGWMPQTEEHLQILAYLGVSRGVVALSKSDLAADLPASIAAIRQKLKGSPLAEAEIIPTSVPAGRGIDELKAALTGVFAGAPEPRDIGKPRLPVDRVFTLKGIGTVVTGTLSGGRLKRGEAVVVQPTGGTAHVRSVQTHQASVELGLPGSRVALNLPDLHPAARRGTRTPGVVGRGDTVTLAGLGGPSPILDVLLQRFARVAAGEPAGRPLKSGTLVHVHHGSGSFAARIHLLECDSLSAGAQALARLLAEEPVYAFVGDRFVVRDWPEQHTLAGGVVLDADPSPGRLREAGLHFLHARAKAPADASVFAATQIARDGHARRDRLLLKSRFSSDEVDAAVDQLSNQGTLVPAGDMLVDAARWRTMRDQSAAAVEAYHRSHPERSGLPLADLRTAVPDFADESLFASVVAELCRDGFARAGTALRRATHLPSLPPRLQQAGQKLRATLAAHPFDPPSKKELARDDLSLQALKFLVASGEAVEVGPDVVLGGNAYANAIEKIRAHLRTHREATVSELKTVLASSRRIMVPLLEKLDRDGVTRRIGDLRVLK